MSRDMIRCDAVLDRRSVVLALSGFAAWGSSASARAVASGPALADLVAADGSASALAWSLAGTEVRVRGFLAPSLNGRDFALTEEPAAPCQLCGDLHAGRGMSVRTAEPNLNAPAFGRVEAAGRLEIDAGIRLTTARIQAL